MKFRPIVDFKDSCGSFEVGDPASPNVYESDRYGLSAARLDALHRAGVLSLEGKEDCELATQAVAVVGEKVAYDG